MLPNFIGVGAARAGTTTLWHVLSSHKDIYLPKQKETAFWGGGHYTTNEFNEDGSTLVNSVDIARYEHNFFGEYAGQAAIGEISPRYFITPSSALDIKNHLGQKTKIIINLRNPVKRAFSQYCFNVKSLLFFDSFERAMSEEVYSKQKPSVSCVVSSLYFENISNYLREFSRDNIHFVIYESDIASNQLQGISKLLEFLGVDATPPIDSATHLNRSPKVKFIIAEESMNISIPRLDGYGEYTQHLPAGSIAMISGWPSWDMIVSYPSNSFKDLITNTCPRITESLDEDFSAFIMKKLFLEDIKRTEDLIGIDLSHWYLQYL